jgi:hypothetical protein
MQAALVDPGYSAAIECFFLIDVVGYDWNCPQHITPRFDADAIAERMAPLEAEIAGLHARIAELTPHPVDGDRP